MYHALFPGAYHRLRLCFIGLKNPNRFAFNDFTPPAPLRSTRITGLLHYYGSVGLLTSFPIKSSFSGIPLPYLLQGEREISPVPLRYYVCSPGSPTPTEFRTSCISMCRILPTLIQNNSASVTSSISRLNHFTLSHSLPYA